MDSFFLSIGHSILKNTTKLHVDILVLGETDNYGIYVESIPVPLFLRHAAIYTTSKFPPIITKSSIK